MSSKLVDAKKTTTVSSTTTMEESRNNKPPAGAIITEESIRTKSEEIENGYLVTKNFSGRYKIKGEKDSDYGHYYDYDMKWYSKEDPLTITVNDSSLAEAFKEI